MKTHRILSRSTVAAVGAAVGSSAARAAPQASKPTTPARGKNSPTLSHQNPSSCVGAARASRNSKGGDREQGAFGESQSEFVRFLIEAPERMSFGEWLQTWKEDCAFPPGRDETEDESADQ
jgi:hypothetical protein